MATRIGYSRTRLWAGDGGIAEALSASSCATPFSQESGQFLCGVIGTLVVVKRLVFISGGISRRWRAKFLL
jgi:hypothetical protein